MHRILISMAMQAEAAPILEAWELSPQALLPEALPMRTFCGQFAGANVCLLLSGTSRLHGVDNIGTEAAAVGLQAALQVFEPDVVINAGTAGGFIARGAAIGDVYLGQSPVRYHDHRIQIPGFDAYGIGSYPCHDSSGLAETLGFKQGHISTGNALDHTPMDDLMMAENQADCKEMEAAALAWVCHLYGLPFIPLKAITDLVDGETPTEQEFLHNLHTASTALQQSLGQLVAELARSDWAATKG